jgi:hypothetical protein
MATIINTLEVIVEPPKQLGPATTTPPAADAGGAPMPMVLADVHERLAWLRLRVFAH